MAPIILHVDMDAFYAAVETQRRPGLVGRPVVIGADPRGGKGRGVVSTANYPARRYGIHSAMPISKAYEACPHAVFLAPDFPAYREASAGVMRILDRYADVLEVVGMDEAYLDVTRAAGDWKRVASFCRSLQAAVRRATGLTCSIGAAPTKSAAKIASDRHKPHGVTVVAPGGLQAFLDPLPVSLISGCGPKTAAVLGEQGLRTIGDLARCHGDGLPSTIGKHGRWLRQVARGDDPRPVVAGRGPAKSRGNERTFLQDETDGRVVSSTARRLLGGLLRDDDRRAFATLTVKIRYSDFSTLTRARTMSIPIDPALPEATTLATSTLDHLLDPLLDGRAVRLIGVRLAGFTRPRGQRALTGFGVRLGCDHRRALHDQTA